MLDESIKCPYCGVSSWVSELPASQLKTGDAPPVEFRESNVRIAVLKCFNSECGEESLWCECWDESGDFYLERIVPKNSRGKSLPDFIPQNIREDYTEACLILNDSPKASATLARRCLQGMIRDFHGIKERTLHAEIKALESKDVTPEMLDALLGMKHIGNIGAHPERMIDVSESDATQLIEMLEVLFEAWYIDRENKTALVKRMAELGQNKPTKTNGDENGTTS